MTPHRHRGLLQGMLGVTLLAVTAFAMIGCAAAIVTPSQTPSASAAPTVALTPEPSSIPTLPPIPPAIPGNALTVFQGPRNSNEVALTFDDGSCEICIGTLVTNLELTGASATFCPNGRYAKNFAPYVARIRVLIAEGRVEMCNHTFSHPDLATLSDAQIRSELLDNEAWIEKTFWVTSRPFFRPPYGAYNARVMQVAGELGFTRVVLWSGSFADSKPSTSPNDTLIAIHMEAAPGLIMLGHANYLSTCVELPEIVAYLTSKGLKTVTLSQLVGTQYP